MSALRALKARSIKGLLWSLSESFGVAVLSLATVAAMARILEPRDFGIVALAGAVVIPLNLFVAHTFTDALVQRATLDPEHSDTAFWSTLGVGSALAALCFGASQAVAALLGEPAVAEVLPWLALLLPLNALAGVQLALLRRAFEFRTIAANTVAGRVAGAAAGLGLAIAGAGLWALVAQQLVGVAVTCAGIAVASRWRPRLRLSLARLRELWRFGMHVSASQMVAGFGEQAVNLVVGTAFGTTALGYFNVAWRLTVLVRTLFSQAIYHVGFSAFSRLQDQREALRTAFVQATRASCLIGFPIGIGMATVAAPLIVLLFGARWQASAPLLALLALELVPAFMGMFLSACYRAMGKPSWVLATSLLYFAVGTGGLIAAAPFGVAAVAAAWTAKSVLLMAVHGWLLRRLLDLPLPQFARPAAAPLAAGAAMAAAVLGVLWALPPGLGAPATLAATVPAGILVYAGTVWLLSPDLLRMTLSSLRLASAPGPEEEEGWAAAPALTPPPGPTARSGGARARAARSAP